jgi:excisionase family DNA binding protein
MEKLLTVRQVAELTTLAPSSIYALITKQAIPHIKLGSRVVFSQAEIENWVSTKSKPTMSTVVNE